jgi:hypothetical protein
MFNKEAFQAAFAAALINLAGAEKVTKVVLLDLSRSVLEAHHATQDVAYMNDLLAVLTPVNKRVAIEYFKEFSGFKYSQDAGKFIHKDKKAYEGIKDKCEEFLADPLNNIWTWQARSLEIEPKEFDAERMKKQAEALLKKADKNGFKQIDVLKAMLSGGLKIETLIALMDEVKAV